ncbi:MAG: FxSxx-COOH system tetratricopeptide repeat protein [Candidatus Methanoperedens sp.]
MPEPQNNPKVFISYSHDSEEHKERVLALSDRLRVDGIECIIDHNETSPSEGWAIWMSNQIAEADFILVVCTETYERRFRGKEETEDGLGAIWEGAIITQKLYEAKAKNTQIIPILLSNAKKSHIPIVLRNATHYRPDTDNGYKTLIDRLKNPHNKLKTNQITSSPQITPKSTTPCNVPFQRNPYFTGREDVLEKLHNSLKSDKAAALAQAISGLGGIGKTQTAVEYTYRYRNEHDAVLWVKADSCEALISDYAALAQVLDLPEKNAKDQNLIVAAVRRWLENNSGWLLVFDNADEPGLLEDYIPINHKGHILLTSRAQQFDKLGISNPVELEKMSLDEAKEFLLKRTGRSKPTEAENEAILKIAEKLDYLPLALEQAGAYIKELKSGFSNYLSSYRTRGLDMFKKYPPVTGKYPKSVATTWLLNFEEVEKTSKASAELLTSSAFFNPDNIPFELIIKGAPELGEPISSAIEGIEEDPLVLDELLLPLTKYSLISRDDNVYSIHRLVQAVIRDRIGTDTQRVWAERTVKALNRAFPAVEFSNWQLCERLIPHAQAGYELIIKWRFEFEEAARLLNNVGLYQYECAFYSEAERVYRCALEIFEKSLGKDHSDVATLINNLALLYYSQGKYDEAETMYKRALAISEQSLDKNHPYVAISLNNLALLYCAQGKFAEAETMFRRALTICEKSLGNDHPDVAQSLNNLALLYDSQGKYDEAETMHRRALEIWEKSLGKYHPDVATSLNNLAMLYVSQGKYAQAEPMNRRALEICEISLGKYHPNVAASLNNIALLYKKQGKSEEAEPLYIRALEILKKSLGSDHPNVAASFSNLAELYRAQRKYDKAEPMCRRALAIREKSLGSDHPDVAQSLNNLAGLYDSQEKYDEAEPMYRRALAIWEKSLGENHPNLATVCENLTALLRKTNREAEAQEMEERTRGIRDKTK